MCTLFSSKLHWLNYILYSNANKFSAYCNCVLMHKSFWTECHVIAARQSLHALIVFVQCKIGRWNQESVRHFFTCIFFSSWGHEKTHQSWCLTSLFALLSNWAGWSGPLLVKGVVLLNIFCTAVSSSCSASESSQLLLCLSFLKPTGTHRTNYQKIISGTIASQSVKVPQRPWLWSHLHFNGLCYAEPQDILCA